MKRWLRVVLPRTVYMASFFLLYITMLVIGLWFSEPEKFFWGSDFVVFLAAFVYGTFRVIAFHPACDEKYLKFLKQTAWTPEKPLPVGPVHLIWQDAFVMMVFVAMVCHPPFDYPFKLFRCGMIWYLLSLSYVFLQSRVWSYMYALLFGLGAAFLFWSNPWPLTGILLGLYGVSFLGIKRSLKVLYQSVEEELSLWSPLSSLSADRNVRLKKVNRLSGWPFDVLASKTPSINTMQGEVTGLSAFHGILIGLLAGWWLFSITIHWMEISESRFDHTANRIVIRVGNQTDLTSQEVEKLRQQLLIVERSAASKKSQKAFWAIVELWGLGLIVCRLSIYCKGHFSPINLWGRLWTFRWIIPGYDRVFISPLCTLIVMFGVYPVLVLYLDIPPLFACPFTITLMFLTALNLGPRRVDWLLTAPCRITPTGEYKNKQLGVFEEV